MNDSAPGLRIDPASHFDRLLGLCARATEHPDLTAALRASAAGYERWSTLAERAEAHGLAPLVRHHLRAANIEAPKDVLVSLTGLGMRHQRMSALREPLLIELVTEFSARGIPLLLLKGAALSYGLYPQPGLRPMRDIDVLVRTEDLAATAALMRALGYAAQDEAGWAGDRSHHHHQPDRVRVVDGTPITIEVHRMLGIRDARVSRTLDALYDASVPLTIGAATARTLGPTDMLVHLHHHAFGTRLHWPDRLRLVSIADLVTLVEARHASIAWSTLREQHRPLWQSLSWLSLVTPWSQAALEHVGLPASAALHDVGRDYTGWPRERLAEHEHDKLAFVRETLLPPQFWLRMRHGGEPTRLGHLRAWLRHLRDLGP